MPAPSRAAGVWRRRRHWGEPASTRSRTIFVRARPCRLRDGSASSERGETEALARSSTRPGRHFVTALAGLGAARDVTRAAPSSPDGARPARTSRAARRQVLQPRDVASARARLRLPEKTCALRGAVATLPNAVAGGSSRRVEGPKSPRRRPREASCGLAVGFWPTARDRARLGVARRYEPNGRGPTRTPPAAGSAPSSERERGREDG